MNVGSYPGGEHILDPLVNTNLSSTPMYRCCAVLFMHPAVQGVGVKVLGLWGLGAANP
jgi:hypothetical protein